MNKSDLEDREYWDSLAAKEKKRVWYAVYDLQGGPIHPNATLDLERQIARIAKKYNLVFDTDVE